MTRTLPFAICLISALLVLGGCSKKPRLPSSSAIVIDPGLSFGSVSNGFTMQQVIDTIGEPDERNDGELKYLNLGFSVHFKSNVVHIITCLNALKQDDSSRKPFAGQTKEGIRIGSSRDEIVRAYGEPSKVESDQKDPGVEVLRYQSLGLFFMLRAGRVLNMAVIFPKSQ